MLLSIVIPCYNSSRFIASTLDMLLLQGLHDSEVIIVNDGSKDETSEIVRKYKKKNPAIHLIDKQNEGVSIARNTGLQAASGKFIYFLDSDDALTNGTLNFYREILSAHPDNLFFAFGYYTEYCGKMLKDYAVEKFNGIVMNSLLLKQSFLSKKLCFHICSCIYESSFLRNNNICFTPGLRIGEDVEFLLKVFQFTPDCVYNSRHCFVYQIRDDSTMQGYKAFSEIHWHSYEVRRDLCLSESYQTKNLKKYSNFFIQNEYLSHLIRYLKSDFNNSEISKNFVIDKKVMFLPSIYGKLKNCIAIKMAKLLPIKILLKNFKR